MNISKRTKLVRHSASVAAGVTVITPTSSVDTAGFSGCLFVVSWGTIVAGGVQSVEIHGSTDNTTFSALAGTNVSVTDTSDDKLTFVDIAHPLQRFLKCVVNRATQNSTVDGITAILYDEGTAPTTHDAATVAGGELHVSPAVGTA